MQKQSASFPHPWFKIGALLLALLMVWQAMEFLLRDYHAREARMQVLQHLSAVGARLDGEINSSLLLLRGLVAIMQTHPDLSPAGFEQLARGLLKSNPGLRSITAAPGMVVSMVHPLAGNEALLGLDYRAHESRHQAAVRAVELRDIVIAGPLNLVQGGRGIIARMPVFIDSQAEPQRQLLWGLVSAVVDIEYLFCRRASQQTNCRFESQSAGLTAAEKTVGCFSVTRLTSAHQMSVWT